MGHKTTVLLERFAKQEKYLSGNGKGTISAREYPDAKQSRLRLLKTDGYDTIGVDTNARPWLGLSPMFVRFVV
jgi:hypothetical protein